MEEIEVATPANPADDKGNRPVPDPTVLTTDQLRREISSLKEILHNENHSLSNLMVEKFKGVDRQFDLVERQRVEQKMDTKAAVDAALTAQKEAVREQTTAFALATNKSEAGTAKQLEQLGVNFTASIRGVSDLLNDLKDRVVKMESVKLGGQESRQEDRSDKAATYAAIGIAVTLILAALTIAAALGFTR